MSLLYLDFDGELPPNLIDRVTWAAQLWQWPVDAIRYDRTRHGWHVVVGVAREIEPALIVAAQAILGSDYKRETFNLMRVQSLDEVSPFWRERWNVLYSHHAKPTRREQWHGTQRIGKTKPSAWTTSAGHVRPSRRKRSSPRTPPSSR